MAEISEHAEIPAELFDKLLPQFAAALAADRDPHGRLVTLDGMPIACCLVTSDGVEQFATSPYRPAVSSLVSHAIGLAWNSCSNSRVRNALAACARYVDDEFRHEALPPQPDPSRILIVGHSEDRTDLLRQLEEHCS
jgi:hypothetical protein